MSVKQTLTAVREMISTPEKWTQGFYARDKSGENISYHASDAACFCLLGAINKATFSANNVQERRNTEMWLSIQISKSHPTRDGIVGFNDSPDTDHAQILKVLDEAIASCP